ncbi:MAG: BamA/TamA family outer membrane protein [Marinilabiliales bacterium]
MKYVPDNEYLLSKVKLKTTNKELDTEELESYIRPKPNRKILGLIRFHLGAYNLFYKEEGSKWRNKIADVIGEEPVLYSDVQVKKSVTQMLLYMQNQGYFNTRISVDTIFRQDKKRAIVKYHIYPGTPYKIDKIEYNIEDDSIASLIFNDTINSYIKKGMIYNLDLMEKERERYTKILRNNGYYYFTKDYIYYLADSNLNDYAINLQINIENPRNSITDSLNTKHKKYTINNVYFYMNYDSKLILKNPDDYFKKLDTLLIDHVYILYIDKPEVNPKVILRANYLHKGKYYSLYDVEETYKHLIATKNFKIVNISFEPSKDTVNNYSLDAHIQLTPFYRQSYSTEIVGTNSSGNLGVGGSFNYQHKSLFYNAEVFDFKINGGIERQTILQQDIDDETIKEVLSFNTIEFGGETQLTIPRFIFFNEGKNYEFTKKYNPQAHINLAYNYQKRSKYTRTIANLSFGYSFVGTKNTMHYVNLFEVNMVDIPVIDSAFYAGLNNPYIRNSYKNYLITSTNYTFIYNNQKINKLKDFHYIRLNIEPAGNFISTLNKITKVTNEGGTYLVLNRKYAQYLKSDIDYRFYHYIDKNNKIVYRFFSGVGYPYGNSTSMPFVKQYFCGGANGIRAWPVRGLGPGSYYDSTQVFNYQTGDIKLEMNIEYRFQWFWIVEGALFVDAGNIWAINEKDTREGALFKFDKFYNDIAVGTGFGFRFNFSFFIFRLDFGIKARDPAQASGEKFVLLNNKSLFKDMISNINIGIGYPF